MQDDDTVVTAHGMQPGDQWHGLVIEEWLGAGAFGEVYRARDTQLERRVALKLYRQEVLGADRERALLREARLLAKVKHTNVVTIHGAETAHERVGLWMEHVAGRDLAAVIRDQGPVAAGDSALAGVTLCSALAAVHGAGILHRDLKPSNIMREKGGRLVLMDFGAGVVGDSAEAVLTTAGSPIWMAPESLRGRGATVRSDIYSLGAVLFALVTGIAPIAGGSYEDIRAAHDDGRRKRLRDVRPDLPPGFVAVVEKALAATPDDRYASAGEFEAALATFLTGVAGTSGPTPVRDAETGIAVSHPGRWSRRTALVGGILLAVALVVWLGPGWREGRVGDYVYSADIEFVGVRNGTSRNLVRGSTVDSRDLITLHARFSRSSHLYVLNVDRTGRVVVMYPMAGTAGDGTLSANTNHRLPGDRAGRTLGWTLDGTRGTEVFLIVASEKPLTEFEGELAGLPAVDVGGGLRVRPAGEPVLAALTRGVTGVVLLDGEPPGASASLARLMTAAEAGTGARSSVSDGVWIEKWHLENLGDGF